MLLRGFRCCWYSRQDAREVECLSDQVRQIAEHEDDQRLNSRDILGEACNERRNESKNNAEKYPPTAHNNESRTSSQNVNRFYAFKFMHLCEGDQYVVQDLGKKKKLLIRNGKYYTCKFTTLHQAE